MTGKSTGRRENKQILQQASPVTSKCLAMVVCVVGETKTVNGKEIFDDFQLRNSTCYWNSALSESIKSLQYLGFLEPSTILLGGSDNCLENLRTAWGRRVLNDPHNCKIEKIGDISSITMQEVPQNHFIPLPEILCLIILDLNNKQILATVDIIQAQLKKCYQGTQLPSNQLVYETLHSLIQERKLFHTGSGYFVVTPDTLCLPVELPAPKVHLQQNSMYLPVSGQIPDLHAAKGVPMTTVAMTQTLPPCRSISCQVTGSVANQKRASTPELRSNDGEKPQFKRSHSARRHRDRSHKDVVSRAQDDCLSNKDVHSMKTKLNKVQVKGEKKSLLSKLFGKKKKGVENKPLAKETKEPKLYNDIKPTKEVKCDKRNVEYATFSAQFPPPEWQWYQELHKKQERTKDWVSQQAGRTLVTLGHKAFRNVQQENKQDLFPYHSHSPTTIPTASSSGHHKTHKHKSKLHTYHEIEAYRPQQPQCVRHTPPDAKPIKDSHHHGNQHTETKTRKSKSHNRRSHRHSMDVGLLHRQAQQEYHTTQRDDMRVPPLYSSTPREGERSKGRTTREYVDMSSSPILREINHADKEHRSRKRRSKHYKRIENDISYEYQGRLPRKHCNIGMSRDSGVNCIGLSENHGNFCYNQLMDYENVKSNNVRKSMEMQLNSLHQSEAGRNEIVCVAEINTCAPPSYSDYVELNSLSAGVTDLTKEKQISSDPTKPDDTSVMDSSEQSYDTVIHNKRVQEVSKGTENLTLGDSGFYSPRITEFELDKNRTKVKVPLYKNLIYDHQELNNLKDIKKEKIVLNNEFYKEPSPSSDYQVVGVV